MFTYFLFTVICIFSFLQIGYSCTNIAITKGASKTNSSLLVYTCDSGDTDFRIIFVPAADHKPDSMRAVYNDAIKGYPRLNIKGRTPYYYDSEYELTKPLDYIEQVPHTYSYIDSIYGVMNEHQLAIGEDTCAAKERIKAEKGKRILDIVTLSKLAMERCKTAKEAVNLMGHLAEKYGYYGWGETLTVADAKEIWVFEICASKNCKAMWVAKKVPDGKIFVSANEFRIRDIIPEAEDIMYSKTLFSDAEKSGWFKPEKDKTFDWLKVVSPGEYNYPYYSLRRVWRIFDKIAPSKKFSPWVENGYTKKYPFAVKPDKLLTLKETFDLTRDWYQETEFDLSMQLAAGPNGNINRHGGSNKLKGDWERALSLFRASYVYVTQSRINYPDCIGGIVWWGYDAPHSTCFVPFYCGINDLPRDYQIGQQRVLDRNTAWWAFNYLENLLNLNFKYMIKDVQEEQNKIENREIKEQPQVDSKALELYKKNPELAKEYLTEYCGENAIAVYKAWWLLSDKLMVKYQDGKMLEDNKFKGIEYEEKWLKAVNYAPIDYSKPNISKSKLTDVGSDDTRNIKN